MQLNFTIVYNDVYINISFISYVLALKGKSLNSFKLICKCIIERIFETVSTYINIYTKRIYSTTTLELTGWTLRIDLMIFTHDDLSRREGKYAGKSILSDTL